MKLVRDAKNFYHKHPKLVWWGGLAGGAALLTSVVYAATRPKKTNVGIGISNLLASSSQGFAYGSTIKGQIELASLVKRLTAMSEVLANGTPIFLQSDAFQNIWTHGGVRALDLIPSIFYDKNGKFSTDELGNHSHCQTWNAQVVQLGNDWLAPFYNTVYRTPPVVANGATYAGTPIDPHTDPGTFNEAVHAAIEANITKALANGDFGGALAGLKKFGINLPFALPGDLSSLYMMVVPSATRDMLARFARDLAAKQNKTLPTTDSDGKPLSSASMTLLHASVGGMMVGGLITMFESHDEKVNPCIKVVDAGLVFEMFMATIGVVLSLALGPALSGISVVIKFATTVNKLAELSK